MAGWAAAVLLAVGAGVGAEAAVGVGATTGLVYGRVVSIGPGGRAVPLPGIVLFGALPDCAAARPSCSTRLATVSVVVRGDGDFTVSLPPGRWAIAGMSEPHAVCGARIVDLTAGQSVEATVTCHRL